MMTISRRLRELRLERGLSQSKLAEATGIPKSTLVSYENNHRTPNLESMTKLEKYFGVSTRYLTGETDIRTISDELLERNQNREKEFKQKNKYITNALNQMYEIFERIGADEEKGKLIMDVLDELTKFADYKYHENQITFDKVMSKEEFIQFRNLNFTYDISFLNYKIMQLMQTNDDKAFEIYMDNINSPRKEEYKKNAVRSNNERIIGKLKNYKIIDKNIY